MNGLPALRIARTNESPRSESIPTQNCMPLNISGHDRPVRHAETTCGASGTYDETWAGLLRI
jgi:hypothetical protein